MTVLPNLAQENEALKARLAAAEALLAKANAPRALTFKVSEKGCLSVYGMNIRGTHLYASQWERILDNADAIRKAIEVNRHLLAWKPKP